MNKHLLQQQIICALEERLSSAQAALKQAHDSATHDENVAENKYDTLGLEAAYLAHGQAQRVEECEEELQRFKKLNIHEQAEGEAIGIGCVIELEDHQSKEDKLLYLSAVAGGLKLKCEKRELSLISTSSPLGKALLGCFEGDEVSINIAGALKRYKIVALY